VDATLTTRFAIIQWWSRTTNKSGVSAEAGVLRIDNIPFLGGVFYTIEVNGIVCSTVNGEAARLRLRLSTSGAATTASAQIAEALANGSSAFVATQSPQLVANYAPGGNATGSILLSLALAGGTGTVSLSASATAPLTIIVKAWGKAPAAPAGVDL
jgi:hypothetical protein